MRIGPLGIWELLIILVVVLLIFGPRRLPEMAKGLGQSVREFRKGIRDIRNDFEEGESADTRPSSSAQPAQAAQAPQATPAAPPPAAAPPATDAEAPAPATAAEPATDAADDAAQGDDEDTRSKAASEA